MGNVAEYLFLKGENIWKIHVDMGRISIKNALIYTTVMKQLDEFNKGTDNTEDNPVLLQ